VLVRARFRLGLPVPPPWRPWAARCLLRRRGRPGRRSRWLRRSRRRLFVAAAAGELVFVGIAVAAGGRVTTQLLPGIVTVPVCGLAFSLVATRAAAPGISRLRWHGLTPDGRIDPAPDRWLTLAALPEPALWTIAALEVVAAVVVGGGLAALLIYRLASL